SQLIGIVRVGAGTSGQAGQLEAGGPSLGALSEGVDVVRLEVQTHHVVHELRRLLAGEPKIAEADLDELVPAAQPGQRQGRVGARGERDAYLRRDVLDEEGEGRVHGRGVGAVIVVQGQDGAPGEPVQVVDERGEHVLSRYARVAVDERLRLGARRV